MGRWKIGSLTAALGCIALGVIIALIQFGQLTYEALGYLWPVLLIAFGLEMLIRVMIPSANKARVSGWAVFLMILLIGASVGQSAMAGSLGSLFQQQRLVDVEGSAELQPGISKIKVDIPYGKVNIEGSNSNTVQYEGSLRIPADSDSEAKQMLSSRWKVTAEGDTLLLRLEGDDSWLSMIHIGLTPGEPYLNVTVPKSLFVEVDTRDGAIEASHLDQGVDVHSSNGKLLMSSIAGGVKAHTSNGSLTLQDIQGEVDAKSSNGAITLERIDGPLVARSSNGRIVIDSDITGDWDCKSSNGRIEMTVPGSAAVTVTADTSNGSLKGNAVWQKDSEDHGTAVIGAGTHKVKLNTSNGSITANVGP